MIFQLADTDSATFIHLGSINWGNESLLIRTNAGFGKAVIFVWGTQKA